MDNTDSQEKDTKEIENVVEEHFLQSKQWMNVKKSSGNNVFKAGGYYFQTTKILYTKMNIGYMPRVDVSEIGWGVLLEKAREANCVYVTIDPINTTPIDVPKEVQIDITPAIQNRNTLLFDLSKTDEQLLADMKKNHRNLVRSSFKKGVSVRFDTEGADLESFFKIYSSTKQRQSYFGRPESYIAAVKDQFRENAIIATASVDGKDLASWFIILHDQIAYLLYAGSIPELRNTNPTYAIFLKSMQYLRSLGAKKFDFYGIADDYKDNKSGYTAYKLGFGGEIVSYCESFNVILSKRVYPFIKLASKLRSKIDLLKKL